MAAIEPFRRAMPLGEALTIIRAADPADRDLHVKRAGLVVIAYLDSLDAALDTMPYLVVARAKELAGG